MYRQDFGPQSPARSGADGLELGSSVLGGKPDGSPDEDLLKMDGDRLSRFRRLGKVACEEVDDIHDFSGEDGGTIQELFDRPPTGSHAEVPAGHPAIEQSPAPGVDGGHFVVAALALGIVGVEAARAVKEAVHKWKDR